MDQTTWRRAQELFETAAALGPEARERFLRDACGPDEELRRLVRELVEAEGGSAAPLATGAGPYLDALLRSPVVGQRIGPYRVVAHIARGGMGEVVLAERDDGAFERRVAIKLLAADAADGEFLQRFLRERRTLARLDHEHIADLIDAGTAADGRPYLVLEYVDGPTILRYCDERRLSIADRLRLFLEVCAAVQHAHDAGVIHRDLKPGNILVRRSDGAPRLVDFGIARLADRAAPDAASLTRTGGRLFTPEYASPEQVRGARVSPATDVYSLGVVLYELLTGQLPYAPAAPGLHELERAICEQDPERPSTAVGRATRASAGVASPAPAADIGAARASDPAALRRALAGDLDVVLLRSLEKEPERRYGSVAEMADDLRRHLDGRPIKARRSGPVYRGLRYARRNRARVVAAALALALIGGAAWTYAWSREASARERVDRVASARNLLRSGVVLREEGKPEEAEAVLRESLAILDDLGAGGDLRAEVQEQLAVALFHAERFPEAEELCRRALAEVTLADAASRRLRGSILNGLAWVQRARGELEGAVRTADEALAWNREHCQAGETALVNSLQERASHCSLAQDIDGAIALLEEAADGLRGAGKAHDPNLGATLAELGLAHARAGRHERALEFSLQAREILTRHYGESHPDVVSVLDNLGASCFRLRRYDEAIRWMQKSLDLRASRLGESHPKVASSYSNLAYAHYGRKDFAEALRCFRKALEIREATLAAGDPDVAHSCFGAAQAADGLGDEAQAEALLRRFLELASDPPSQPPARLAQARRMLGAILLDRRSYGEAEALLLAAHELAGQAERGSAEEGQVRELLRRLYRELGREDQAERYRPSSGP